ncbi:glycosyltransferase family 2 protein [Microbacterium sp. ZW T6_19]|uniref:glycosyltransferase family 2 protein n=1 Tax=Microbacterium sp. ZW T6_19 TaxID=3378082 RepID=UPI003851FEFF
MASAEEHASEPSVAICIPTFRRPADLTRLLAALPKTIEAARGAGLLGDFVVIVIDNDEAESARAIASEAPLPVRYVVELERGVVAVRNRALDEAAGSALMVFIDDDETPADVGWLSLMLRAREDFGAGLVAGPVRTVTEGPLDPWVVAGGFFARAHRSGLGTGSPLTRAATNNLLLDLSLVERSGVRFDPRFGRTGGEDSLFTSQLHAHGVRMVWCAEAVVLDHLPVERQTRAHALERTAGMANAGARVALALAGTRPRRIAVRLRSVASGVVHWIGGASRGIAGAVLGSERLVAVGAKERARGRGSIAGAGNRSRDLYGGGGVR